MVVRGGQSGLREKCRGGLRGLGGDFSKRKADVSVRCVEVKVEFEGEGKGEPAGTKTSGTSRAEQGKAVQCRLNEATV